MKTKEELIMLSTFNLLNDKDFSMITVADIAKKAGIGKGTIYEYFSSKEQIFCEAMVFGMNLYIKTLKEKMMSGDMDIISMVNKFIDINFEIINNNHSFFSLISNFPERLITNSNNKKEILSNFKKFKSDMYSLFETILKRAHLEGKAQAISSLKIAVLIQALTTYILRSSKLGIWALYDGEYDNEKDRTEIIEIVTKIFI